MKFAIHDLALEEFIESAVYYEDQEYGLGDEFTYEVNQGFAQIIAYPEAWPMIYHNTRAYLVKRFDFRIIYMILHDEIFVTSISHCARKPLYWTDRLSE